MEVFNENHVLCKAVGQSLKDQNVGGYKKNGKCSVALVRDFKLKQQTL